MHDVWIIPLLWHSSKLMFTGLWVAREDVKMPRFHTNPLYIEEDMYFLSLDLRTYIHQAYACMCYFFIFSLAYRTYPYSLG